VTIDLPANPTQLAGLIALAASTLACIWAARRTRGGGWLALALVHAVLWLDILLNTRHLVHDAVNGLLRASGVYAQRAWLQAALLALLAALGWWGWRRRQRAGMATAATALLLALVVVEMISWHQSDRLLYTHVGPLLLIAYAWIACAAVVVWAALRR
jgi:hypothetical protein